VPKSLDQLEQLISQCLAVEQHVLHLSANEQQQLVGVVNVHLWIRHCWLQEVFQLSPDILRPTWNSYKKSLCWIYVCVAATTILWLLYRTTCVSLQLQLRTGRFCWSKVLVPACSCCWQLVH